MRHLAFGPGITCTIPNFVKEQYYIMYGPLMTVLRYPLWRENRLLDNTMFRSRALGSRLYLDEPDALTYRSILTRRP